MDARTSRCTPDRYDPLTLAASTWLACGMVLYGFAPLPLHDATFGWSAAFWLLAAPALVLAARRAFVVGGQRVRASRGGRPTRRCRQAIRWRGPAARRRSAQRPLHAATPAALRQPEGRVRSAAR